MDIAVPGLVVRVSADPSEKTEFLTGGKTGSFSSGQTTGPTMHNHILLGVMGLVRPLVSEKIHV